MPTAIPNVTIFAPVIRFKNDVYLVDGQYAPRHLAVPCGINALVLDELTWATPIKDSGIVTTLSFVVAVGDYPPSNPPTPDSILTLRVIDKYNRDYVWYLTCTREQYYASCAACCGDAPVAIPEPLLPVIIPCQQICANYSGAFVATFAYVEDIGQYWIYGYFNGTVLPTQTAATIAALVILLNANWKNIGTPSRSFVWAASNGVLTATGNANSDEDSLCVLVFSIAPSP